MIGWNIRLLYLAPDKTNINDAIVLEKKSFFTIPTIYNGEVVTLQRAEPNYIATTLNRIFGDDYSTIYSNPYISSSNPILTIEMVDKITEAVSSIFLASKFLVDEVRSGNQYGNIIIHLISINKYIQCEDGGASLILLDSVGNITGYSNIQSRVSFGSFSIPTSGTSIPFIINYDTSKSLNEQSFGEIKIRFGTPLSSLTLEFSVSNSNSIFKKSVLFNSSDEPDFDVLPPIDPENPYEPGGDSGEGGGGGSFDDESDQISDSSLPTLSSANTGFTRIYNPTLSQVQSLAQYLWTDESVIATIWNHIKQFFENPMEAIIAFNLIPVSVPDGGTKNFALMYIDTGVQMTVAANQFVDVDCGTLEVKEYYGSALDYSPNTKISCFLPFIGTVTLNTDEVMNTTLQVKYRVDICSGSCVAKILVNGNVLYQYSGHCAIPIPLSAADFSTYVTAAISVGKLVGTALTAGAGVAAAVGAEDAAQQTNQIVTTTQITNTARNPSTGRQITTGTQTVVETREAPADQSSTQASFNGLSAQNIANTVGQVMSSKPHIEHSGGFSGNSGYLGIRRPFLIIERPNMCMPANFQSLNGFPSMITLELGTCKGFTRVQQVQLTGLSATNPEQAELLQLLKSGVIL